MSILLALIFSICCALPASAASLEELTPYFSGHYFVWEEHQNNRQILKETGPLFSAGLLVGGSTDASLTLRGKAEVFGGVVDYDGETQSDAVPVQTQVNYLGVKNQFDLGYPMAYGAGRVEPFGGLGHRLWLRELESSRDANGQRVSGYTEYWQTGYGRFGVRGRYQAGADLSLFAEGGAIYPFYTGNTTYLLGPRTTFHPRGKLSGFAEIGATWRRLRLSLDYEGFRWGQSPAKRGFLQPESSSDLVGLSIGWNFR